MGNSDFHLPASSIDLAARHRAAALEGCRCLRAGDISTRSRDDTAFSSAILFRCADTAFPWLPGGCPQRISYMAEQKLCQFDSQRSLGVRAAGLSAHGPLHRTVLSCRDAHHSHVETSADRPRLLGKSSFLCICSVRWLGHAEHDSHFGYLDFGAADSTERTRDRSEALGLVRDPTLWRISNTAFEQCFGCITPDLLLDSSISTSCNRGTAWSGTDSIRFQSTVGAANVCRSSGGPALYHCGKYDYQGVVHWRAYYLSLAGWDDISLATSAAL